MIASTVTYTASAKNAMPIARTVGFSHRSGFFRVNCHATATAERTSMNESRPNPISAADDAAAPAATAIMPSRML